MKLGKLASVVLAFGALAALLSGCVVFKAPPVAKQIGKKPKVKVAFTLCESDSEGTTNCPRLGNDEGSDFPNGSSGRLLVGLRVPKGTKAPRRFTQKSGDLASAFSRDGSYKRELNAKAPKGPKFKWFGYISTTTSQWKGDGDSVGLQGRYKVKLRVPKRLVGKKFKVRPVIGGTQEQQPGEIDCGKSVFEYQDTDGDTFNDILCINDPAPGQLRHIKVKIKRRR
jgi:hypothetical protein